MNAAVIPDAVRAAAARLATAGSRWWRRRITARARDATTALAGQSLMVLAPHPDDETFGCGAMITRARAGGQPVTVVVATDGSRSTASATLSPGQLAAIRTAELRMACGRLGVGAADIVQIGHEDGGLMARIPDLIVTLGQLLAERRPDIVLVPCVQAPHPDHRALHLAGVAAAAGSHPVWAYPVWTWHCAPWFIGTAPSRQLALFCWAVRQVLWGRWLRVPCGPYLAHKRAAIGQYASQTSNLTAEPTWNHLPPAFVRSFLAKAEVFLPVRTTRGAAHTTPRVRRPDR